MKFFRINCFITLGYFVKLINYEKIKTIETEGVQGVVASTKSAWQPSPSGRMEATETNPFNHTSR